jgi:hypothetical protein
VEAPPANWFINIQGADQLNLLISDDPLGESCLLPAIQTDRALLFDDLSQRQQIGDPTECFLLESCIQCRHDNNFAFVGPFLAKFNQIIKKLTFIYRDDVKRVDSIVNTSKLANFYGFQHLLVMRRAEFSSGVSIISDIVQHKTFLFGNFMARDPPYKLRGLATEHWTKNDLDTTFVVHYLKNSFLLFIIYRELLA